MMTGWTEEIVWTRTDDGIDHDGVVMRPTGPATGTVVVWMHGFTGHFSEPHQIRIGRYLAERGHHFVSGNNRGHHYGGNLGQWEGPFRIGGAYWELVSESWLDIKAWLDYAAATLAPQRLVLAGHSYGAVKVTWYQGERQDTRLAGLISASGPVRSPAQRPELQAPLKLARQMVAEGRGLELLPFGSTGRPGSRSAQTVVDRGDHLPDVYGTGGGGDSPLSKVKVPFLAILGTSEPAIGSPADLNTLKANATSSAAASTALIEGANHLYQGCEVAVAEAIYGWLGTLP